MTDKASAASYISNAIAFLFGVVTLQEIGLIVGLILGVATYITNYHFKKKQLQLLAEKEAREKELHSIQLSKSHKENSSK